jgi:hypothetical protein
LYSRAQSAAITTDGSSADASAMLDVKSTNKGMLVPRMTTAQRTAIVSPAKGLLVFDNDTGDFWFYNGTAWTSLTSGAPVNVWAKSGDNIVNTNPGNVGIGGEAGSYALTVTRDANRSGILSKGSNGNSGIISIAGDNSDAALYLSNRTNIIWIMQNDFSDNNSFQIIENGRGSRIKIQPVTGNVGIDTDNPTAKLQVTGNAKFSDEVTVQNGKGIVRSTNSTQLKIFRGQLGFTVTLGATPQIYVGNVLSYSSADWMKISILPVEVSSTGCKFRIYNHSSTTATVTAVYQYMVMGAE